MPLGNELVPAGQGRAGVTVPVRAGLSLQRVPKVTTSRSVLECCLGGVFQDGCFPSCSCSGILRGCDLCEPPSPRLGFSFTEGGWGRAENQELRTFILKSMLSAAMQGCSQCPVPAVLGWVSCRSVWCASFGGLVVRILLGQLEFLWLFLALTCKILCGSYNLFQTLHSSSSSGCISEAFCLSWYLQGPWLRLLLLQSCCQ